MLSFGTYNFTHEHYLLGKGAEQAAVQLIPFFDARKVLG